MLFVILKSLHQFKVETIYHSAAYKHVPMIEFNNSEGVINNIFGTLSCVEAAISENVEAFVKLFDPSILPPLEGDRI